MELIEQALERAQICREDEYADGLTRAEWLALADEVTRLRHAAGAYLATTEGRAVTFREGLTRAELAAAVEGKP